METYIRDALAAGIQPSLSPLGVDFIFVGKKDKYSAWNPGVLLVVATVQGHRGVHGGLYGLCTGKFLASGFRGTPTTSTNSW